MLFDHNGRAVVTEQQWLLVFMLQIYDVPDTDDADADTDDDAGPCEDIVVLAKTYNGASEDTYCGSDDDDRYIYIIIYIIYIFIYT